jgi:prepilin-type N-terminal cleavage/methylation domain-containing protein
MMKLQQQVVQPLTKNSKRQDGFTLIEVMMAMALLGIVFLTMAQLLAIAVQQNSFSRYNSIGIEVARGQLEELNALYNNELATGVPAQELLTGEYGPIEVAVEAPEGSNQQDRIFDVSWTVTRGSGNNAEVTVTVNPRVQNPLQNKEITISSRFAP